MDTTHEHLHLNKWRLVLCKIMEIPASFIWIIILFDEHLGMAMARNFEAILRQIINLSL
jgi:hypothetical protein